jgi:transposase
MPKKIEFRYEKRVAAVTAVQRGEAPKIVSRVMNIRLNTLYEWLSRYRNGGWQALREGYRSGRPRKVSGTTLKWIYDAITMGDPRQFQFEFCLWTRRIVRAMLKKYHGIEISLASVGRLLKQLGLSSQKPIYKAYQQNPEAVDLWLKKEYPGIVRKAKMNDADIYFADEAGFRSDHHNGKTWSPVGVTPVVDEHRGKFGVNCISAVSAKGLLRFKLFEGRMNSSLFITFLTGLQADADKAVYVIVDRAKYHVSKEVKEFLREQKGKIRLFYLPAYSPELNPDEQVWNSAKNRVGRICVENKNHMKEVVSKTLRSMKKKVSLILSFFKLETTQYATI